SDIKRICGGIIENVVAVISKRRRVEGQQPQARDAEIGQVGKLLRQTGEVANAVISAGVERTNVYLVNERVLVPERIRLRFLNSDLRLSAFEQLVHSRIV